MTEDRPEADADPTASTTQPTDTSSTMSESADTDPESTAAEAESATTDAESSRTVPEGVERYVRYILLAGLTLLALVALLRFYFAASNAISVWVTREYQSIFQALFNLIILLVTGIGISWQVRKLR